MCHTNGGIRMAGKVPKLTTPRAVKTQNTKDGIIKAATDILKKKGYAYLTVSNICAVAGISNGTFFYHFKTKEELLTYYTHEKFAEFRQNHGFEAAVKNLPFDKKIIEFYSYWADYMVSMGLDFFSNFYSTSNYSLDIRLWSNQGPASMWQYPTECLVEAQHEGLLMDGISVPECQEILATIMKGVAFDWCLSKAAFDMHTRICKIMGPYLDTVIKARRSGGGL